MAPTTNQHHHRSTTKVSHKPYKSRFASKGSLKDQSKGKIERLERGHRKTPHQNMMSKLDRRNQTKHRRLNSHLDHVKATSVFAGRDGAPRNVAVIPLCNDIAAATAVRTLNASLEIDNEISAEGFTRLRIDRFNQKLNYITVKRDLISALDASKVADFVLFVLSAATEVDEIGESIIRAVEGQGLSQAYTAVLGLEEISPPKRRSQVAASLKSFITHFLPEQEKVFSLESRQESQNLIRSLCTSTPRGIKWREDRSWMFIENVHWPAGNVDISNGDSQTASQAILTGVVRGKGLKADRLVQVGDWGTFQIDKIVAAPLQQPSRKGKEHAMAVDNDPSSAILEEPTEDQDDLQDLAPEEVVMEDADDTIVSTTISERKGVLLDDHRYFEGAENENVANLPSRLPRGTSKYQAAWYLGDFSDSGSDMEDFDDTDTGLGDDMQSMGVASGEGQHPADDQTEGGPSEYPESEMDVDLLPDEEAEQLAAHRARRKDDEREHLEFPDEIELPPNVLARDRLARYRGLKSQKTSTWDTEEDKIYEPEDWNRLLEIHDYRGARSKATREALLGGVKPGTRVSIHLRNVPRSLEHVHDSNKSLALFSLLRHEHKRTTVNFSITMSSDASDSIKSKEELVVQCGPRRFIVNPLFSQTGNNPNNVYKFDRYLHPGQTAVASFIAPITWGAVPTLFFKRSKAEQNATEMQTDFTPAPPANPLIMVAHGTALPTTPRIIAKRIVLTGQPFKINRKLVTVRYMFFNAEDVAWFQALQLWTNRGRQGTIKDSLGTHGYFKAVFDGKIGMQDAVGISLWKRVWPRPARLLGPGQ